MGSNTMGNAATTGRRLSARLLRPEIASVGILVPGAAVIGLDRATMGH